LGSNLEDPPAQLRLALLALATMTESRLAAVSRWYWNRPLGGADQPDYLNAVAALDTRLEPLALLNLLLEIEARQGRRRGGVWEARTLDLDLLLYGQVSLAHPRLTLPHAAMARRRFVLQPLCELAPELEIPGLGGIAALLASAPPWEMRVHAPA
jgi:2-amino-4-hydroxy-6-hydroxymethyldihydropteridine diphosphokinase